MTTARRTEGALALPHRLASLDGLRGVAAVVVLIHHCMLTVPLLARAYYPDGAAVPRGSAAWWLAYSPLHLVWGGAEAVLLFFVLSGIVVVLPALRSPRFDWIAFYPRRVIRIYGPVACAVVLGAGLALLVPRFDDRTLGTWINNRPDTVTPATVLSDLSLLDRTSGVISPLWSLQWELLFSALLPLFVGVAVLGRRRPLIAVLIVATSLVGGAMLDGRVFFYFSMFGAGALLIGCWDRIAAAAIHVSRHRWAWPVVVVIAVLLASSEWTVQGLGVDAATADAWRWLEVPGIVLLLLAVAFWRPATRLFEGRVLQWLGRISFSLYLVHEPIVVSMRLLLVGERIPTWVSIAIAVPVSLGVAHLFSRLVEQPFHRLARTAGRAAARAVEETLTPERRVEPRRPDAARPPAVAQPRTTERQDDRQVLTSAGV